jgi:hypothetical protein
MTLFTGDFPQVARHFPGLRGGRFRRPSPCQHGAWLIGY